MRIILSVDAIRQPLTGVGRYTLELAHQLATMPDLDLAFLQGRDLRDVIPVPGAAHALLPTLRDMLSAFPLPTNIYRHYQGLIRARALRHEGHAILHGANYYLPAFPGRSLVTIHDVSVFTAPEQHRADRVRYMRKEVALALQRAELIITVSAFSKAEIIRVLGVEPDRIRITPLGYNRRFRPHPADEMAVALSRFGLRPDGYCLYVGTIEPRKNLTTLLDAFERLSLQQRRRHPLVLAGYSGWKSEDMHARFAKAAREGWLTYLGYVPDEDMPALMAGARLFVFPSLSEGFGLPVLEAMACGVPVVCSDAAALMEVAGDVAATAPALDVAALTCAISMAADDEAWRARARTQGLARSASFTWERCAQMTRAIYREAAAR